MRKVVVSYLQAKQVWKPSAAYAGNTARKDPDAMDIGHGKGKGKDGKGKEGKKSKGKESKGKSKESNTSGKGTKSTESKDRCAICWKTSHTTEKCWFSKKGQENGKGKKSVSAVTEGDTSSVVSAGPSASQVAVASSASHPRRSKSRKVL